MDFRLRSYCSKHNITYSRYADDLTFSFSNKILDKWRIYLYFIKKIIISEGFVINEKKSHLSLKRQRHSITGIIANQKANLPRKKIKKLRTILHNWEVDGYVIASNKFLMNYLRDPKNLTKQNIKMENIVNGYLSFLKMVKGNNDSTYLKLSQRFKMLLIRDEKHLK